MRRVTTPDEFTLFPRPGPGAHRVGVVCPAPYPVAMGNLGVQWVIRQVEGEPGFSVERFFPGGGAAPPRSLETGRALGGCDLLACSVSFEPDYLELLRLLLAGGIPPLAADRMDRHPLIWAGGAALQVNPEPLAPFIDLAVVGEGEGILGPLLRRWREVAGDRREFLSSVAGWPGVYVPSHPSVGPVRVEPADLAAGDPPFSNILSRQTAFGEAMLVEIGRGCPLGCRYCWAGFRYRPVRPFSADAVLRLARSARSGGVAKVGLVSTAVCQHPELTRLLDGLRELGLGVGMSSLRLTDLTPGLLDRLAASGEDTLTLAPETGDPGLRRVINKGFSDQDVLDCCAEAFRRGIRRLRLYVMVGLPGERPEHLDATARLVERIHGLLREAQPAWGRPGGLVVSVAPFVPKPNTPFQHLEILPAADLRRRVGVLGRAVSRLGQVEVHVESVRSAQLQAVLARGTRQTGRLLLEVATGRLSLAGFVRRPSGWTGEGRPPWAVLDWGLDPSFLRREWDRAQAGELTGPCPGGAVCRTCGICGGKG